MFCLAHEPVKKSDVTVSFDEDPSHYRKLVRNITHRDDDDPQCERFTFGVGAVPKSSARDVLGGFEPVVNYSVKPLASVGGILCVLFYFTAGVLPRKKKFPSPSRSPPLPCPRDTSRPLLRRSVGYLRRQRHNKLMLTDATVFRGHFRTALQGLA